MAAALAAAAQAMVLLDWQKSSYSSEGNNCINVATTPDGSIHLRESDDPAVTIRTTPAGLATLLLAAKAGEFDRPTFVVQQ